MKSSARYDPVTFQVIGANTPYEEFHENAHLEQHMRHTLPWRLREAFVARPWLRWTGLGSLAACICELEALLIARGEMKACHLWHPNDRKEAVRAFASYLWHMVSEF